MSEFDKYQEKKKEKKRIKKMKAKQEKEAKRKMGKMSEAEIKKLEKDKERNRAALTMLIGDGQDDEEDMDFKGDFADSRFKDRLSKDKDFARDPTHKHFNKMEQGKKKQRR